MLRRSRHFVSWVYENNWTLDSIFLYADSKDSDQTRQVPRLIWVFAGRTGHFVGFVVAFVVLRLKYSQQKTCYTEAALETNELVFLLTGCFSQSPIKIRRYAVLKLLSMIVYTTGFRQYSSQPSIVVQIWWIGYSNSVSIRFNTKYGNVPRKNMKNIHIIMADSRNALFCGLLDFHFLIRLKLLNAEQPILA